MSQVSRNRRWFSLREIFTAPLVLAILSAAGLLSALVGDGIYDAFSWFALGTPVAICGLNILRAKS